MSDPELIYFDDEDEKRDGLGWNVVSTGGSVSLRFATRQECIEWCESHGLAYTWKKRSDIHGWI